jgi:hypothetical protein
MSIGRRLVAGASLAIVSAVFWGAATVLLVALEFFVIRPGSYTGGPAFVIPVFTFGLLRGVVAGILFAAAIAVAARWSGDAVLRPRSSAVIGAICGFVVWTGVQGLIGPPFLLVGWGPALVSGAFAMGIGALNSLMITSIARRGQLPPAAARPAIEST